MDSENVQTIRAFVERINAGDFGGALAGADENFEWDMSRSFNADLKGVHRGRDRVLEVLNAFTELWETFEMVVEEYIEVGDKVVTVGGPRATGRAGIEVSATGGQLWEFRDGRPSAAHQCQSKEEALKLAEDG